jgi:hypothetical protein
LAGLRSPFCFVYAEDEKPQGEQVFSDERDAQNYAYWWWHWANHMV